MARTDVSHLLDRITNLPSVPRVIRELMAEFERPEPDVDQVVKLIGSDPVLSVKLLRLANSSFFGRRGSVGRLNDAVVFVGMHATRNLVMSVGLASSIRFPEDFPKKAFWRYSLHSAVAARHVATVSRQDPATSFALGLMRAVGEPLAATVNESKLQEIDAVCPFFDGERTRVERAHLGYSYVDVSAALAERWHFPAQMVAALRQSDRPDPDSDLARMGAAVGLGAWIAGEQESKGRLTVSSGAACDYIRTLSIREGMLKDMPPLQELAQGLDVLVN